jgi:transcriptional regulator with XRE-family HTH domain
VPDRRTPASIDEVIAANIKLARERNGWSQADVVRRAALVGFPWSRSTVADIEIARRSVSAEELIALPSIVGVELSDLLRWDGDVVIGEWIYPGKTLVKIIRDRSLRVEPSAAETRPPDETEEVAARALGIDRERVIELSLKRWGHRLVDERDKRLSPSPGVDTSRRRGRITRKLIQELAEDLT